MGGIGLPASPAAAFSAGVYTVAVNGTSPALSAAGRYVAFLTTDPLAPADTNGLQDAYVRDVQTGQVTMVSTRGAVDVDISDDGTRVAYIEPTGVTAGEAWVRDLPTGTLLNATRGPSNQPPDSQLLDLDLSGDGKSVTFDTQATTLLPVSGAVRHVFVKRLDTGALTLGSTSPTGAPSTGTGNIYPSLSFDGSFVTFVSNATNLVPVSSAGPQRFYRKNLSDGSVAVFDLPGLTVSTQPAVNASASRAVLQTSLVSNGFPGPLEFYDLSAGTFRAAPLGACPGGAGRPALDGAGRHTALVCVAQPTVELVDQDSGAALTAHTANASAVAVSADGQAWAWEDRGSRTTLLQVERLTSTDDSPPVISYQLSPPAPDGDNGWYVSDVTLGWHVDDPDSAVVSTGCHDTLVAADQAATTYTCSASSDGGSSGPVTVTVKRDATPPAIAATVTPAAPDGASGWYVTSPLVTYDCADATSLVASCPAPSPVGEGVTTQVTGTARDNAGNTAGVATGPFRVDLTNPSVTCPEPPSILLHAAGATLSAVVSDGQSGPAQPTVTADLPTSSVGAGAVSETGSDLAGRTTTATCGFRVVYGFTGFSSPVDTDAVNVAKAGRAIPLKWRVVDAAGAPVTQLTSATVTSAAHGCTSGLPEDAVEEFASGASALQNLGDGYYQFNWKPASTYAGSCRTMRLDLGDAVAHSAEFRFTG